MSRLLALLAAAVPGAALAQAEITPFEYDAQGRHSTVGNLSPMEFEGWRVHTNHVSIKAGPARSETTYAIVAFGVAPRVHGALDGVASS